MRRHAVTKIVRDRFTHPIQLSHTQKLHYIYLHRRSPRAAVTVLPNLCHPSLVRKNEAASTCRILTTVAMRFAARCGANPPASDIRGCEDVLRIDRASWGCDFRIEEHCNSPQPPIQPRYTPHQPISDRFDGSNEMRD